MLDPSMNWDDVAEMVRHWNGQFCLKGVMSPSRRQTRRRDRFVPALLFPTMAADSLTARRASFDQLAEIVDAVGDRIDVFHGRRGAARDACPQGALGRGQGGGGRPAIISIP